MNKFLRRAQLCLRIFGTPTAESTPAHDYSKCDLFRDGDDRQVNMADGQAPSVLGQTIVNFVRDGVFPEDDEVSKSYVEGAALASALNAVVTARAELEVGVPELLFRGLR